MTHTAKVLFLTTFFFSLSACNQSINKPKDTRFYNLFGDVQTVMTTFDYSHQSNTDDSFAPQSVKLSFNSSGMLLEAVNSSTDLTNPDNKPSLMTSKYQYDDEERLVTQYDSYDLEQPQVTNFLYHDSELLPYASTMFDGHETQMTNLTYDSNGNLVNAVSMTQQLEISTKYSAKYNSDSQLIENQFSYKDSYNSSMTIIYNQDKTVKSETRMSNGDKSVLTYEYLKSDSHGNWIERKVYSSEKEGYVIEKRTINYF